jgi:hypothetical protein
MELLFSAPDGRDRAIDSNKYHTLVRAVLSSAQSKAQLIYHQAMKNLGCWRADVVMKHDAETNPWVLQTGLHNERV